MTVLKSVTSSYEQVGVALMRLSTYCGVRSSFGEMSTKRTLPKRHSVSMSECTVRPKVRSPHRPIVRPFTRPNRDCSVARSASVCVGCMWPPSPALITGTEEASAATRAAPSFG